MQVWLHTWRRAMKSLHSDCCATGPWRSFCLVLLLLLAAAACSPRNESPPTLVKQGWVSDYASKLKPDEKARISAALERYEKETCHQIFLLIIPSLGGENIAEFSQRTASAWEIGQPGLGNGFLVTIALQEGSVRIETGSAFEWFIRDGTADKILKEVMLPLFRQDRFVEGVERGLAEIMVAGRLKPISEGHKPAVCRQQN
jgi:uncharacterized protein